MFHLHIHRQYWYRDLRNLTAFVARMVWSWSHGKHVSTATPIALKRLSTPGDWVHSQSHEQLLERFCIPFYGFFKRESLSDRVRVRPAASRRWLSTKTVLHFGGRFGGLFDGFVVQDEPSSCPGAVGSAHCSSSDCARRQRSGRRRTSSSKSTRSPAAYCFSNDVSVWVAPAKNMLLVKVWICSMIMISQQEPSLKKNFFFFSHAEWKALQLVSCPHFSLPWSTGLRGLCSTCSTARLSLIASCPSFLFFCAVREEDLSGLPRSS